MRYMVIETFRPGQRESVNRRFRQKGRMLPEGLAYLDSWLEAEGNRCFQLMETSEAALLQAWSEGWNDLVSFEFIALNDEG